MQEENTDMMYKYIYSELFNKPYEEFKFVAADKGSLDIDAVMLVRSSTNQKKVPA